MEWKDIPGYENLYSVSSTGDIYSYYTNKVLKPSMSSDGYKQCVLYKDKKPNIMLNHKAVALAFMPCQDTSLVINHIDEDKNNCSVNNLEWVTRKENNNYMGNRATQAIFEKYSKVLYAYDPVTLDLIELGQGFNKYARDHNLASSTLCSVIDANRNRNQNFRTYKGIIYTDKQLSKEDN